MAMIERIYVENDKTNKINVKSKEYNYDIGTVFKGVALLVIDMWFPSEEMDNSIDTWENLFEKVEGDYKSKNTIIKNDCSCSFEFEKGVSIILEFPVDIDICDIKDSIYQILDFLEERKWEGKIPDFLPIKQRKIRNYINKTDNVIPLKCLHESFFDCSEKYSEKIALEWLTVENTWESITYNILKKKVLQVAALLKINGVRKQDCVAVILPKSEKQIIAVIGILSIGAIYVPVGIHQPLERKKKILESAKIEYTITNKDYISEINQIGNIGISLIEESDKYDPMRNEEVVKEVDYIAYIIFTSGTTGIPKGVMITHKAAYNTIYDVNNKFEIREEDCAIAVSELDFDLSVYDIFGMLGCGASLIVLNEENKREPAIWAKIMSEKQVTIWNSVPALFEMFLLAIGEDYSKASLKNILLSGDWIKLELYFKVHQLWPLCKFISLGGATEAAIWSVFYEVRKLDKEWVSIPYGQPLANQFLRVVNDKGKDTPIGVPGELWIGGCGVAEGYVNEKNLTDKKFIKISGIRWYKTGDKAQYLKDGNIQFLGRIDDQVKLNGYRIELGEIENVIKKFEKIDDAVAMIVERNGKKEIMAAVVSKLNSVKTSMKVLMNKENQEYLNAMELRKRAVVAFILEMYGNNVNKLNVGDNIDICNTTIVEKYWNNWMINSDLIRRKDDVNYTLNIDIQNVVLDKWYLELRAQIPVLQGFMNGNISTNDLFANSYFSPEELLIQGADSIMFLQCAAKLLKENSKVAILGSRTGAAVEVLLKNIIYKTVEFTLLDESGGMLKKAKERLKQCAFQLEYNVIEDGMLDEQLLEGFDFVIAVGSLHRYRKPLYGLRIAEMLLKPSGKLLMLEYEMLDPMAIVSSAILENGFLDYSRKRNNTALLTMEEWLEVFEQSAFKEVSVEAFPTSSALFINASLNEYGGQTFQKEFGRYLKNSLVNYMLPQEIINFVWFPLSENGKVDRKRIRQMMENRKHTETKNKNYIGIEIEVAKMWSQMLNVEDVGRNDNFFEIGGDSLLATSFVEDLKQKYDIKMSLKEIFNYPELDRISRIIEEKIECNEQMIEGEI